MSRRSITAKAWAEGTFAVRVHLRTPEGGFSAYNDLQTLLREKLGSAFHISSERGFAAETSSVVIYANDLDAVCSIIHQLGCEVNRVHSAYISN